MTRSQVRVLPGARVGDAVIIDRHFCGPPDSANGGYTCGMTAGALGVPSAEVTLRRPPPLGAVLRVERSNDGVALVVGDQVISEGRPARVGLDPPSPVGFDEAVHAAQTFDIEGYAARHPFPTCYTCGPSRPGDDGLGLFPAPIPGRAGTVAWPWVPDASGADADGVIEPTIVWAALDCPSGLAWLAEGGSDPAVLGRMTAEVRRRPLVGEHLVVAGWRVADRGRKLEAGSAVWSTDGEVIARSASTWVRLTDDQQRTFKTAT
jgi:hypothetical protein